MQKSSTELRSDLSGPFGSSTPFGSPETLTKLCTKEIIQKELPVECLEKLVNQAVVYVPIQKNKAYQSDKGKILETYFLGAVFSTMEKATGAIPKGKEDQVFILKYYLNPVIRTVEVYVFDMDTIPFVTNDFQYFKEMWEIHKRCNKCYGLDDLTLFTYQVDSVKTLRMEEIDTDLMSPYWEAEYGLPDPEPQVEIIERRCPFEGASLHGGSPPKNCTDRSHFPPPDL